MKPLSLDTSAETQRIQFELLRQLPPSKRLALALELTDFARGMMLAGLRSRFPASGDKEIKRRFIKSLLPRGHGPRAYVSILRSKLIETNMDAPAVVLLQFTTVLEKLGITYAVVGSLASSYHGSYRSTNDIDILADIGLAYVEPLVAALKEHFYVDELTVRRAIAQNGSFNAIHFDSVFKVDVFIPKIDDFARNQLQRRVSARLAPNVELPIYLASAEDTILAKLCWYRKGGDTSEMQWRDVLGILGAPAAKLDTDYLNSWAEELRVVDLLQRALSESAQP